MYKNMNRVKEKEKEKEKGEFLLKIGIRFFLVTDNETLC
ncbi:hypothetical protein BTGOE7_14220 [Bacillus thuringiensis]|nr:hypothetical protein BTGOE7_14220 [Bacillus thuringiensis]